MSRERRRTIIILCAILFLVALTLAIPGLRNRVRYRREYGPSPEYMGFVTFGLGYRSVSRFTGEPAGPFIYWSRQTGKVILEGSSGSLETNPWGDKFRDGDFDTTEPGEIPSAPWIADGITPDEWWKRVKPDR